MIRFQCPGCGHSYGVPKADAGKRAKCNSCKKPFNVPAPTTFEQGVATEAKPKSGLPFANMPLPLKVVLALFLIAMLSYGIYESMPSIRELDRADAERERLNKLVAEQRAERHAKVIAKLTGDQSDQTALTDLDLKPGDDVVLQSQDGGYVRVYPTSKDWSDAATLAARNDEDGLISMALGGRILSNKSGTPAKYLSSGLEAYEVRIKGGEFDHLSGWVLKEHVRKMSKAVQQQPIATQPTSTPHVPVAGQPAPAPPIGPRPAPVPQTPVAGAATSSRDTRAKWVNDTYKDRVVRRDGTGAWQEVDSNTGAIIWEERETSRTKEYVEVFCPKRNYEIRIFADRMELNQEGKWTWVANGRWADVR